MIKRAVSITKVETRRFGSRALSRAAARSSSHAYVPLGARLMAVYVTADSYYHQLNSYTTSGPWCSYVTPGDTRRSLCMPVPRYASPYAPPRILYRVGRLASHDLRLGSLRVVCVCRTSYRCCDNRADFRVNGQLGKNLVRYVICCPLPLPAPTQAK